MEEGGPGGKQSSSYKTISGGLEEPIRLRQLPPTKSNRKTPALLHLFRDQKVQG